MKKKFFVALLCTAMMACSMTVYAEPGDPAQQEEEILVENTAPEQEEEVPAKDTSPEQEEEVPAENTSPEQEEEVSVEETSPELDDVIEALYSSPQGITKVSGKVGEDFTFNDITAVPTFTSEWTEAEIIDFSMSVGEYTDDNYTINNESHSVTIIPQTPTAHYTFWISSITVSNGEQTFQFYIPSDKYGDGNFFAFSFKVSEETEPEASPNDSSDNQNEDSDNSSTEDNNNNNEDAEEIVPEDPKNVVNTGNTNVVSTVNGVYSADAIDGLAVKTPYEAVCTAAGISTATTENEKISLYVCDNRNRLEQDIFSEAAELIGRNMISMVDVDMYHFTGNDCQSVKTVQTPIEITMALPEWAVHQNTVFSILCVDEAGQLVILPDLDTNANTITVQTTCMGAFAIVAN